MEYRRSRWASRHPLLTFGVLPLPATLLAMLATLLPFGLAAEGIDRWFGDDFGEHSRTTMMVFAYSAWRWSRFVPFALLAVLFTRLGPLDLVRQLGVVRERVRRTQSVKYWRDRWCRG